MLNTILEVAQLALIAYVWWTVRTHQHDPIRIEIPSVTATDVSPTLTADNDAAIRKIARALARKVISEARQRKTEVEALSVEKVEPQSERRVESRVAVAPSAAHGLIAEHLEQLRERRQRRREARQ